MTNPTHIHIGSESMPHLPAWMSIPIHNLSSSLSLPADQFRLVLCLLLAIPFGFLHQYIPGVKAKHIYSAIIGIWYGYFVVGYGLFYVWAHALVVYILCALLPRTRAPGIVFILSMALLSASHLYRMYTDYLGWSLDVTLIQMVYAVKSVTFAYNWADGQAVNAKERLHANHKIHDFREARALFQFPSLLEYHSYTFFFGGLLVGPCFECREYLEFTNRTVFKQADLKSIPSTIVPTLKVLLNAFLCYIGVVISGIYPVNGFLDTDKFCEMSIGPKFIYFWIAITSSRFKYYFAWYLGEAACVACGFGFSGATTHGGVTTYHWDRACNCHAFIVETSSSMPLITNHWNMGVNNWLKNYVYFRVEAPHWVTRYIPAKSFQNIVTKLTSAAWHGFYSAYYFFFLGAWLVNEMDDAYRAAFEWRVTKFDKDGKILGHQYPAKYIYNFIGWFLVFSGMNYLGVAFMLLEATASISFWKCMYLFGTIGPIVLILLFKPLRQPRHKHAHGATKTGDKASATTTTETATETVTKTGTTVTADDKKTNNVATTDGTSTKASSSKKKSKKAE